MKADGPHLDGAATSATLMHNNKGRQLHHSNIGRYKTLYLPSVMAFPVWALAASRNLTWDTSEVV